MTIDMMILNNHVVLDSHRLKLDKTLIWGKVVNLSSKTLKDQGKSKTMKFQGMIQADGIGVSVLKQNKETSQGETNSRKFSKLRQNTKPKEVKQSESYLSKHPASTLNVLQFAEYLKARARVHGILPTYYTNEDKECHSNDLFPFRKMRLSSFVNKQQSDSRLSAKIRVKFGNDSVIVIGDWSAANQKYHEPIRGKDVFRLSHLQNGELEKVAKTPNPRPFRRARQPIVLCHGLLRCTNQEFLESRNQWNRDLVAVLNFKAIMESHQQALGRSSKFQRQILKRPSTYIEASYSKKVRSMPTR
ncbi:hypothetical protein G6F70_000427 [Rhizopus microsporus]|nr:hypothetical protein G6F71_002565 [Rhizopus microsporus]KAG1204476.1 hypothetical protein G6F70_000427 [Rhizopus microsporus]KAG1215832.1 hypothetical protein G6F69_000643 [Rhizopus microsporus]KAG1236290.1 hypothetical protein G6F67_002113 [Rhizopus microsporus]